MVSFGYITSNWYCFTATQEEWEIIKYLMNRAANPDQEIYDLYQMSGHEQEDFQGWLKQFKNKDTPPDTLHRSRLATLFAFANNAEEAYVKGITAKQRQIIDDIRNTDFSKINISSRR